MPNKQKRRSVEAKGRGGDSKTLYEQKEEQQVELIDRILSEENLKKAIKAVKQNKGAPGIDNMTVDELDAYFLEHGEEIKTQIRAKKYKPQPVRRVYIPKANGKKTTTGNTHSSRPSNPTGSSTSAVKGLREILQ